MNNPFFGMLKQAALLSFKSNAKWYLGSFTTAVGTFLVFKNQLAFSIIYSIISGCILLILSFVLKTLIEYERLMRSEIKANKELSLLSSSRISELESSIEKMLDENNKTLNSLKDQNSKILELEMVVAASVVDNAYGNAIVVLATMFSKVHSLRKVKKSDFYACVDILEYVCNNIKKIFEHKSKYIYSVSVKILDPDPDTRLVDAYARVVTLCRDDESFRKRDVYKVTEHNILGNTCFLEIFMKTNKLSKAFYVNNDLCEHEAYKNTSFDTYGHLPDGLTSQTERKRDWTLPYRSELVVPIHPFDESLDKKVQFIGYLCVDCNEENAFNVQYDVPMIKGVADGIFDLMNQHKASKTFV